MFDCMTTQPFDSATRTCKQNGKRLRCALYVGAFRRSRLRQMHQQVAMEFERCLSKNPTMMQNKWPHSLGYLCCSREKKAATDRFTSWLSKKRHDKTLVLHLFIVTRGASSPNEPSSLGIFVLSDLSESCEPIESLTAKNSEVVQYDNCTWLGQDCELPSRLCCFGVSFSSTCHIRK